MKAPIRVLALLMETAPAAARASAIAGASPAEPTISMADPARRPQRSGLPIIS
jgi:hypothetical protein